MSLRMSWGPLSAALCCGLVTLACGPTGSSGPLQCEGPETCNDHGTCDDSSGEVVCTCEHGYAGARCEDCAAGFVSSGGGACGPVAPCTPGFCGAHGTCDDLTGYATCLCDLGYSGAYCESCAANYQDYGDGECRPTDPCSVDSTCTAQHRECTPDNGIPICGPCLEGYYEQGGACIEACAAESIPGLLVPLDMYIMFDQSGSMSTTDGAVTRWEAVTTALQDFVQQPTAAGIGVGLQYFPLEGGAVCPPLCSVDADCGSCAPCFMNICLGMGNETCDPTLYATPEVPIATLPGVANAVISSMAAHGPSGGTPTSAALQGALDYTNSWIAANPTHVGLVVLATDGDPTDCDTNIGNIAAIAATGANATPQIRTFVIGVGTELSSLNQIAASGGTGQAYLVDTGGNVTQQFVDALNDIRASGACMYQIPEPSEGTINYDMINVNLVDPADPTNPTTVLYVADEASCDPTTGGWYYDDPSAPQMILLCPATCDTVRLNDVAVEILVGCETVVN